MFTVLQTTTPALITPYEYALMSQAVYLKTSRSEATDVLSLQAEMHLYQLGWKKLKNRPDLNSAGYYGAGYQHEGKKHIVIAHRGTDFSIVQNFLSDVDIAFNRLPDSCQHARLFSQTIRQLDLFEEYQFSETGHSLGSIYAEANAQFFNCPAVTFDSPGCMKILQLNHENDGKITNYLAAPDIVNTCSSHPKNTIRLFVPYIEFDGLLFSEISHFKKTLMDLAKNILDIVFSSSTAIAVNSLLKLFMRAGEELISFLIFHETQMHSMKNILSCFHPEIGQPLLQQQIVSWPGRLDYLNAKLNPAAYNPWQYLSETLTLKKPLKKINSRYEAFFSTMSNYQAADFLIPSLSMDHHSMFHIDSYVASALQAHSEFYMNKPDINNELAIRLNHFKLSIPWDRLSLAPASISDCSSSL